MTFGYAYESELLFFKREREQQKQLNRNFVGQTISSDKAPTKMTYN